MKFNKAVFVNIEDSHFDEQYWDTLNSLYETKISLKREDPNLLNELADCDVLLLGFQVPVGRDLLAAAPNLKLINILATAYGTVDIEEAKRRSIPVCNLGGYSTEAVAEFTIAMLLYQSRQLGEGVSRGKVGNYDFSGIKAREFKDSNFGVIGLGSIGGRVAEIASGFGANVSYWSRQQKDSPFGFKDLESLLRDSDFISINVAQSPETEGMINASNIDLIKPGTVIINTVPPEVVDNATLINRLQRGDITYISDHGGEMSIEDETILRELKNCLLVPPIGFITDEARINKQEAFVTNMQAVLNGSVQNKVN